MKNNLHIKKAGNCCCIVHAPFTNCLVSPVVSPRQLAFFAVTLEPIQTHEEVPEVPNSVDIAYFPPQDGINYRMRPKCCNKPPNKLFEAVSFALALTETNQNQPHV